MEKGHEDSDTDERPREDGVDEMEDVGAARDEKEVHVDSADKDDQQVVEGSLEVLTLLAFLVHISKNTDAYVVPLMWEVLVLILFY